nr:MAG TPA: hypothetical protein [Caudoviricetes sp.]
MVTEIQKHFEIMAEVIDFVCWTLGDIKSHSLQIGTTGGIRFLSVIRSGSEGLSSTDQVD